MIYGHGGNIYALAQQNRCRPDDIIDMSSNLNPLGPPPGLLAFLRENITAVQALPDAGATRLIETFETVHGIDRGRVLAGHGTTEFIYNLTRALQPQNVLIFGPTYSDYEDSCRQNHCSYEYRIARAENGFRHDPNRIAADLKDSDLAFICNPNNPTGTLLSRDDLHRICADHPDTFFVIDESYLPFFQEADSISMMHASLKNVIVLSSMSKIFSIPGLRTGFLTASPEVAEACRTLQVPWNVNSLAQLAADFILTHTTEMDAFIRKTQRFIQAEQAAFLSHFQETDAVSCFYSQVPYILIRFNNRLTANSVFSDLCRDNILIRDCSNFQGLSGQYIRIALKNRRANEMAAGKLMQRIRSS